MINAKSLDNELLYDLMQKYRKKFGEPAFIVEVPTGSTLLPNDLTEEKLIKDIEKCLKEGIKLTEIYPCLKYKSKNFKGRKI